MGGMGRGWRGEGRGHVVKLEEQNGGEGHCSTPVLGKSVNGITSDYTQDEAEHAGKSIVSIIQNYCTRSLAPIISLLSNSQSVSIHAGFLRLYDALIDWKTGRWVAWSFERT